MWIRGDKEQHELIKSEQLKVYVCHSVRADGFVLIVSGEAMQRAGRECHARCILSHPAHLLNYFIYSCISYQKATHTALGTQKPKFSQRVE